MQKIKWNVFFWRLLLSLLSVLIVVAAFLFLFIGCKGCENIKKDTWHSLDFDSKNKLDQIK